MAATAIAPSKIISENQGAEKLSPEVIFGQTAAQQIPVTETLQEQDISATATGEETAAPPPLDRKTLFANTNINLDKFKNNNTPAENDADMEFGLESLADDLEGVCRITKP